MQLDFSSKGLLREFLDPESNIRSDDFCYQKSNSLIADRVLTKLTNVYGRDCVSIRILPEQLAILKSTIEKHGIAMVQIDGRPLDYGVIAKIKQEHPNIYFCYEGELDHKFYSDILNNHKFDPHCHQGLLCYKS